MFNRLFGKAKPSVSDAMRDTLFGDLPLDRWPPEDDPPEVFPWSAFVMGRNNLAKSDTANAIACWNEVLDTPDLESRHYLQAWHFLRQNGCEPPPHIAKKVMGVVVEVGMPRGLDLLAAYPEYSARYYNFSGAGVVWERPDSSLDAIISELLSAAAQVVAQIGPWDKERPAAPPSGIARLCFLTPSGLHFGQGPLNALASDPLSGGVLQRATVLMQSLMAKSQE